jgi:ZIP family zinc transporter
MLQMIAFSAVAGICGTGLGGLLSVIILRRSSENMTCWMLSLAAGVMTSIVCFGLIPEAFGLANMGVCVSGLILGIAVVLVLNRLVDKITKTKEDGGSGTADLKIHHTPEEMYHESQFIHTKTRLLRSGVLILIAIGLHNIPEGIAIGAGGSHDFRLGTLLAMMIALHNIPEGMAIAAPLLAGGVNRGKVILLTALSGAPTLLGGVIGMLIGNISDLAIAVSLSAAGGAMLYVVFGEIIPQSIIMTKNRTASLVALFGIIVGLIVTRI